MKNLKHVSTMIYEISTAAVRLKESNILKEEVINRANDLTMELLNKLEKCIDCLELDCCKKPCGCDEEEINCKDEYFINLGIKWNMSEDKNANISAVNLLSLEQLQELSKEVAYGMYMDKETCTSEYEKPWNIMYEEAKLVDPEKDYWINFLTTAIQNS